MTTTISFLRRAAVGVALCAGSLACSSVLGIERAQCDAEQYPECRGESPLCTDYCTTVMANCQDDLAQYTTMGNCLSVCARLPPGQAGDMQGDSIQCRLWQAKTVADLPQQEKVSSCAGAGPGGDLSCGDMCDAVCTIMATACTGNHQEFPDIGSCKNSCNEAQQVGVPFTAAPTPANIQHSPTIECRLWHACAASESAVPHCDHAAGGTVCSDSTM